MSLKRKETQANSVWQEHRQEGWCSKLTMPQSIGKSCLCKSGKANINFWSIIYLFIYLFIYYSYDLVTILEDVNRDLSIKKSKYRAGDVSAVSTFVSCLRGPIFFQ